MATDQVTLLSHSMLGTIDHDLVLSSGKTVLAGTTVIILPETLASCVLTPEGESLAATWPSISREGHTHGELFDLAAQVVKVSERLYDYDTNYPHSEIANFSAQLVRLSERVATLEAANNTQPTPAA